MAIDINKVYKTVLILLEKNKRGALMPREFNLLASQAQREIFNEYFDDYNKLLRMPNTGVAYADRLAILDEKISIFKRSTEHSIWQNRVQNSQIIIKELGTVTYKGRLAQRIQRDELYTTMQSPLTAPTAHYPAYLYEEDLITILPDSLPNEDFVVRLDYLAYPQDPKWAFTINPELGNFVYNDKDSLHPALHESEQTLLIDKILGLAGATAQDQLATNMANNKEQQINFNKQK